MPKYKHVLLAADLIPSDDDPVSEKAAAVAREHGAELSLIHVIEYQSYTYGTPLVSTNYADWQAELSEAAKENVAKLGERLGIPPERQYLPTGQAKTLILETAEKIGADLIILGSHARHGIGLVLLGSTANGVLHGAKCDVLAVRVSEPAGV